MIFLVKQIQENELIILWTSGVKKLKIVNLFVISLFILIFYLFFLLLTPLALNKSRNLLNKEVQLLLPTIEFNNLVILLKDLLL